MAIILTRTEQNLFQDIFHSNKYFNLVHESLDQIVYYGICRKYFTNMPTAIPNTSLYPPNSTLIIPGESHLENLLISKKSISRIYY